MNVVEGLVLAIAIAAAASALLSAQSAWTYAKAAEHYAKIASGNAIAATESTPHTTWGGVNDPS